MSVFKKLVSNDFKVVTSYEVDDFIADFAGLDVSFDAFQSIEYRGRTLVDVAVGFCRYINVVLAEIAALAHYDGVDTVIVGRVVGYYYKRRHI